MSHLHVNDQTGEKEDKNVIVSEIIARDVSALELIK